MNKLKNLAIYAPSVVRIGVCVVFLWFGFNQLMSTGNWTGMVPEWASSIFGSSETVVLLNGWAEVVLAFTLLLGIQTRIAAFLLAVHLFGIASTFGVSPIGVRDFGLALATFSVFLGGPDPLCLDLKMQNRNPAIIGAL